MTNNPYFYLEGTEGTNYPSLLTSLPDNIKQLDFLAHEQYIKGFDPNRVILKYKNLKLISMGFIKVPSLN